MLNLSKLCYDVNSFALEPSSARKDLVLIAVPRY